MNKNNNYRWHFALLLWLLSAGNALAATEYPDVWLRELPDIDDSHSLGFFQLGEESEIDPFDNKDDVALLLKIPGTGEFGGRVNPEVILVGFFSGKTVTGRLASRELTSRMSEKLGRDYYTYYVMTESGKYISLQSIYSFPKTTDIKYKPHLETGYYYKTKSSYFFGERNSRYATCEVATEYNIWDDFYAGHKWQKYVLIKTERPVDTICPYLGNEPLYDFPPLTSYFDSKPRFFLYRLNDGTALLPMKANMVRIRLDGTVPEAYRDRIVLVDAERMHAFKQQLLETMRADGRLHRSEAFQIINDEIEKEFFPIKAGFDCSKASTKVEKQICGSVVLSNLDADLSRRYKKALVVTADVDALRKSQRKWLAQRNLCEDWLCFELQYHARLQELDYVLMAPKP